MLESLHYAHVISAPDLIFLLLIFRIADTGTVHSIKFSYDKRLLAIQRSPRTVVIKIRLSQEFFLPVVRRPVCAVTCLFKSMIEIRSWAASNTPCVLYVIILLTHFHSWAQKVHSLNILRSNCMSEAVRICSIIISHLSKLWKVKFSILCDVIFLGGCRGNLILITLRGERVNPSTPDSSKVHSPNL